MQILPLGERRKFYIVNELGEYKWMSRVRTVQEVAHYNKTGKHHPSTEANDAEAAESVGVKAV